MSRRSLIHLAALLSAALSGCGPAQAPNPNGGSVAIEQGDTVALNANGMFRTIQKRGGIEHIGRIDGNISDSFSASVTAEEDQFVVITGRASGSDQSKVMIFSSEAEKLCDYRLDGVSPFPLPAAYRRNDRETQQQVLVTSRRNAIPLQSGGKRYLVVGAAGLWSPSSMVVLEATSRDEFVERAVFWNYGVVGHIFIQEDWLIYSAVNNAEFEGRHGYSRAIALFELNELLSGERPKGRSPAEDDVSTDPDRQYRIYVRFPPDVLVEWSGLSVEGTALVAVTGSGLTVRVPIDAGEITMTSDDSFRLEYERQGRAESLPEFLERMRAGARVWRRAP